MGEFETVNGKKGKSPEEIDLGLRERTEEMREEMDLGLGERREEMRGKPKKKKK